MIEGSLVIDTGSGSVKAGFAGHRRPQCVFPTITSDNTIPVVDGFVINWEGIEDIWRQTFSALKVAPVNYAVLLSEGSFNTPKNREKSTEVMFETFHVPAMYLAKQALLSLHTTIHGTGVVVDAGHDSTYITPVIDGKIVPHGVLRLGVGANMLTSYMGRLLSHRCWQHERGYASFEPFFNPWLVNISNSGIHDLIRTAIRQCGNVLDQDNLYSNIVFCGGSSAIKGIHERLIWELPDKSKIFSPIDRNILVWKGGSLLAFDPEFQTNMCITRKDYDEFGSLIVFRKCAPNIGPN